MSSSLATARALCLGVCRGPYVVRAPGRNLADWLNRRTLMLREIVSMRHCEPPRDGPAGTIRMERYTDKHFNTSPDLS